jgi:hypothetical protein
MTISLGNRAKMSTSTTGTGTITLGSAVSGFQTFADAGITNGQTVRYAIDDGANFEIGSGTYTSSGTTLTRSVTESSNSDSAISLSGNAEVFIAATVADLNPLYAANESSPSAQPSATGTNAVAIGDSSTAGGNYAAAMGSFSVAGGVNAFSGLGTANGDYAVALGVSSTANSERAVALGNSAVTAAVKAIAIGYHSSASATSAAAISRANASGADSFAAAIGTNNTGYGATATNSVSLGSYNKASGYQSAAVGGFGNVSNGNSSFATGYQSYANGDFCFASGLYSKAAIYGTTAHASGYFSGIGDAQGCMYVLRSDTTDATAEAMTTNNSTAAATNQIVAATDTCITFHGTITAMQNGAQAYAGWEIKGMLVNDGGTTTLALGNVSDMAATNASSWAVALSADNTNNALKIQVTGEASHNIRWVANVQTAEVTYA